MIMIECKFHHVGVVTADVAASREFYAALGYTASQDYDDPYQQATIVLLRAKHGPIVELVKPNNLQSPAAGWVDRIKAGPYHTCYEVKEIAQTMPQFKEFKVVRVSPIVPAVAFGMRKIVFLWGKQCGLIELLESGR